MMIQVYFSMTYISHPKEISVKSTWASIPLSSVISKFIVLSELFRQPTYVKQYIAGISWEEMFWSFREMVSGLYEKPYEYLGHSLNPGEKEFFESIRSCGTLDEQFETTIRLSGPEIWAESYGIH
jgi:hypothetical protein